MQERYVGLKNNKTVRVYLEEGDGTKLAKANMSDLPIIIETSGIYYCLSNASDRQKRQEFIERMKSVGIKYKEV